MKVTVMQLSGESLEGAFEAADTMRDVALWIRTKMGIPIAVQHLVNGETVYKDPSLRLRDAFPDMEEAEEVTLTVLRSPYTKKERQELFQRLVRSTAAGDTRQVHELMKEGAPVRLETESMVDVSVNLEHWDDIEEQATEPQKETETTEKSEETKERESEDEEMKDASSGGEESEVCSSSSHSDMEEEVSEDGLPCGGLTPLLMAMATGRDDLASDFRHIGAEEPDLVPKTPSLREAVTRGRVLDITRHLMAGADPDLPLRRGEGIRATENGTLLHACAANHKQPGMYEVAQLLIHKKANLDAGDSEGDTPLAHARYFNAPDLYKLYSGSGATLAGPFYAAARWEHRGNAALLRHMMLLRNHLGEEE